MLGSTTQSCAPSNAAQQARDQTQGSPVTAAPKAQPGAHSGSKQSGRPSRSSSAALLQISKKAGQSSKQPESWQSAKPSPSLSAASKQRAPSSRQESKAAHSRSAQ